MTCHSSISICSGLYAGTLYGRTWWFITLAFIYYPWSSSYAAFEWSCTGCKCNQCLGETYCDYCQDFPHTHTQHQKSIHASSYHICILTWLILRQKFNRLFLCSKTYIVPKFYDISPTTFSSTIIQLTGTQIGLYRITRATALPSYCRMWQSTFHLV